VNRDSDLSALKPFVQRWFLPGRQATELIVNLRDEGFAEYRYYVEVRTPGQQVRMIIYDQTRMAGWDIIFHVTGSALFNYKAYVPALLSALAAGIISNVPGALAYYAPRVLNGSVVFNSIQFLVSLIVVNRVREAGTRFNATQEAYVKFSANLMNIAMLVAAAIDNSRMKMQMSWT
jgi:hypothetical protein